MIRRLPFLLASLAFFLGSCRSSALPPGAVAVNWGDFKATLSTNRWFDIGAEIADVTAVENRKMNAALPLHATFLQGYRGAEGSILLVSRLTPGKTEETMQVDRISSYLETLRKKMPASASPVVEIERQPWGLSATLAFRMNGQSFGKRIYYKKASGEALMLDFAVPESGLTADLMVAVQSLAATIRP